MSNSTPEEPSVDIPTDPSTIDSSTDVSGALLDSAPSTVGDDATELISGVLDPELAEDPIENGGAEDPILDVMAVLEAERDGYLLDLQRVTAEFANYRKQADRRTIEIGGRVRGDLVEKLLPVFDACDLALEHSAHDVAPIRASLVQVLQSDGLEVLDPVNEPFDPNRHEAVLHEPADDDDDTGQVVIEVLRRGYAWGGRVLRPAMVRVRG
ncbi:MAG: nucleotide exchange factor GrpE [Acidimicrobiales bacterium]|nr:nucleotide exchange factor GrpE [Acidimicrobiales bacterium]